jgi:hypothetical protein
MYFTRFTLGLTIPLELYERKGRGDLKIPKMMMKKLEDILEECESCCINERLKIRMQRFRSTLGLSFLIIDIVELQEMLGEVNPVQTLTGISHDSE